MTDEVTERKHWKKSLAINLVGAIATAVVLTVFVTTKFMHGAWLVVVMIPLLVMMFLAIHRHYLSVARELSLETIHDTLAADPSHRDRADLGHPPRRNEGSSIRKIDLARKCDRRLRRF